MSLRLLTVSDFDITDIEAEPIRLDILHYGEVLDPSSLDDLKELEKEQIYKWTPKTTPTAFYVEGMFQSLHYLLTLQTEWGKGEFPLNFLTGSRLDIGEIGWGKATFYKSAEVKQISEALNSLDYAELARRYNATFFNEMKIYSRGYTWTQEDAESLLTKTKELASFVSDAASNSLGMYRVLV